MLSGAMSTPADPPRSAPGLYGIGTSVYAERDGKILILKRSQGAAPGAWYIPGGVLDPGETPEQGAARELLEEAGLVPAGPLEIVGLIPMHLYGEPSFLATYACECPHGEVKLSDEHSGARWIDPIEYRDRYFALEAIERLRVREPRIAEMSLAVRRGLDQYIEWRARRRPVAAG
jgi:8-oxo-dGTP pyrophosphatase MutT (NUDIX family)